MNKRCNSLDLFRIICFMGVLWLHCAQDNTFHACLSSLGKLSVSCFIMMSGAMVMSGDKVYSPGQWYVKTVKKLVVPWLAACLFYMTENVLLTIKHGETYSLSEDAGSLLRYGYPVRGWHLWYMYLMILIYFTVPFLKYIRKKRSKLYYLLFAAFFLIDMVWDPSVWILVFITYIWKFMAGDIIWRSLSDLSPYRRHLTFAISCLCIACRMCGVVLGRLGRMDITYVEGPLFSAVICVLAMISFSNMDLKTDYYRFSGHIMFVYIIHVFVGDVFSGVMIALGLDSYVSWWTILRDSSVILILSYGMAYGAAIIFGLLRQRKIT